MAKTIEELRQSPYHQQSGQKMCAAFVAQQQGISLNTAVKKVSEPVGDLWLVVAEFAKQACTETHGANYASKLLRQSMESIM